MARLFLVLLIFSGSLVANGCGGGAASQPAVVPPPADPLPDPSSGEVHRMQKKIDLAP